MNDFREFLKISIFSNYWITDSLDLGYLSVITESTVLHITYYFLSAFFYVEGLSR